MNGLVSVLIPIYNGEQYIRKCMDSIFNQTYKNYEIIIVNDGSTDASEDIVYEYLAVDTRIRYFSQNNMGAACARNRCIREARGEWFFFVDVDDWIEFNALEICVKEIKKYSLDVIIFRHSIEYSNRSEYSAWLFPNQVCSGIQYMSACIKKRFIYIQPWKGIFRKDVIVANQIYFTPNILCEDEEWLPIVLVNAKTVKEIPVVLYHHNVVEGSLGKRNQNHQKIRDMLYIETKLTQYYDIHISDKIAQRISKDYAVRKYINIVLCNEIDAHFAKRIVKVEWLIKNAYFIKTKIQIYMFLISPMFYRKTVNFMKNKLRIRRNIFYKQHERKGNIY